MDVKNHVDQTGANGLRICFNGGLVTRSVFSKATQPQFHVQVQNLSSLPEDHGECTCVLCCNAHNESQTPREHPAGSGI
jgi:hypothetical protein